ncbi:MAG: histidine phosphatase family protein [Gammaproteobacteria bacterium]
MVSSVTNKRTTVDFLRHGDVQGGRRFRGRTDDPLAEIGWQKMFQQCQGREWQLVVTSPLRRCQSFASAWGQERETKVVIEDDWREIDFGDWEGLTSDEIDRLYPGSLVRYYASPLEYTPPGAECYLNFAGRVWNAWEGLLKDYAGHDILVITHAGVIRSLFTALLHIPHQQSFNIEIPHACLTRFSCYDDDLAGRFIQLNFHQPI